MATFRESDGHFLWDFPIFLFPNRLDITPNNESPTVSYVSWIQSGGVYLCSDSWPSWPLPVG